MSLIEEEGKKHYVLIKDLNTYMHNHTLRCGRKYSCLYCLQTFSKEEISKAHIKVCFKINGKQTTKMPKNVNKLNSKIMKGK